MKKFFNYGIQLSFFNYEFFLILFICMYVMLKKLWNIYYI